LIVSRITDANDRTPAVKSKHAEWISLDDAGEVDQAARGRRGDDAAGEIS
jgi:hypothetical protein